METEIEKYRTLIKRFPDNDLFRFSLGKALFNQNQFQEATEHLEIALNKKPDWMMVCILLGHCAIKQDKIEQARLFWKRALKLATEQNHKDPQCELQQLLDSLP